MATVLHFDISVDNPECARTFYESLFNWKFKHAPGPMNYYLIETKDLKGQAGIGGGIGEMAERDKHSLPGIINFVGVESIDHSLALVEKLGEKIIQSKQAVPGYGYLATCIDTKNNVFDLSQEENIVTKIY